MERKYIWLNDSKETAYVEFQEEFEYTGGKAVLKITADYKYAAFVNGQFVGNAQFTDIPEYKTFSEYDITSFVKTGKNKLLIQAYHSDVGGFVCRVMTPCIAFEVREGDSVVACSSEKTLVRKDERYSLAKKFSYMLGWGYNYSFIEKEAPWQNSRVIQPSFIEYEKPIKNTRHTIRECGVSVSGAFKYNGGNTASDVMQRAWLQTQRFNVGSEGVDVELEDKKDFPFTLSSKGEGDGVFVVGDLGCECAGYPYFSILCEKETTAYLGWGEHLTDLRLRVNRDGHNFAVKIQLKKGRNDFSEYLRRIAGRYLCLYIEGAESFTVEKLGLMEELYPLKKQKKDFGDRLLNKIYETGRRTLEICMHEHYEDCPLREQALYGLDARNQMLFGYGAFEEYDFARASLDLMAKCIREDGFLPITVPAKDEGTIPPFAPYWVLAVAENVERDYKESFLQGVISAVEKVIEACRRNTKNNKIYAPKAAEYWVFHEWSDGLSGHEIRERDEKGKILCNIDLADAPFSALACRTAKAAAKLEERLGNTQKAQEFAEYAATLAEGLYDFYDEAKGVFASYIGKDGKFGYHEYTQSLFLLTDELKEKEKNQIVRALKGEGTKLIPCTLSGLQLKYDGLLRYSNSLDYVIDDICRIFGDMLFKGATSFWETEKGESDFWNSGSLCHGWSAVACYVLDNYYKNLA